MTLPEQSIDAVILAGTHRDSRRLLKGRNKAFLEVGGEVMLKRVVQAALQAHSIRRVVVVGPIDELRRFREQHDLDFVEVDHSSNMVENSWAGFLATLAPEDHVLTPPSERPGIQPLQPGRTRPDFHELYGQVAHEMGIRRSQRLPMHRWEWIVREYRYYLGRVGYPYPPDFEVNATNRMLADREVIHIEDGCLSFRTTELQSQYARFHQIMNKPVFFLSGDIPLLTPQALDDFVARCYPLDKDYYVGLCNESTLKPYHSGQQGGIRRPFVNLYEYRTRLANLNINKPNRIGRIKLIQRGFELRKMKEWYSVIRLGALLLAFPGRVHMVKILTYAQIAAVLVRHGLARRSMFFRRRLRLDDISSTISRALLADCTFITTPFGGASLDVDTEEDLEVVEMNWNRWLGYQHEIARRMGYALEGSIRRSGTPAP